MTDIATGHLLDAIAETCPGCMVTDWVLLVETIDPDGRISIDMVTANDASRDYIRRLLQNAAEHIRRTE